MPCNHQNKQHASTPSYPGRTRQGAYEQRVSGKDSGQSTLTSWTPAVLVRLNRTAGVTN